MEIEINKYEENENNMEMCSENEDEKRTKNSTKIEKIKCVSVHNSVDNMNNKKNEKSCTKLFRNLKIVVKHNKISHPPGNYYDNTTLASEKENILKVLSNDFALFSTMKMLNQLIKENNVDEPTRLMIDGTFKCVPKEIKEISGLDKDSQLLVIHKIFRKNVSDVRKMSSKSYFQKTYPLCFVLLKNKQLCTYKMVFERLKKIIQNKFQRSLKIDVVHTDFERALYEAIKNCFHCKVRLSWFHYTQNVIRTLKEKKVSSD